MARSPRRPASGSTGGEGVPGDAVTSSSCIASARLHDARRNYGDSRTVDGAGIVHGGAGRGYRRGAHGGRIHAYRSAA